MIPEDQEKTQKAFCSYNFTKTRTNITQNALNCMIYITSNDIILRKRKIVDKHATCFCVILCVCLCTGHVVVVALET